MKQFLEVGKIVNTHGIKGELKLQLWCDSADFLKQFKTLYLDENGSEELTLAAVRAHKNGAILKFAEIKSIDEAEKYKNRVLFCNREDAVIDEGTRYIQDLIGCTVTDAKTGEEYGSVADVLNYGASDILELKYGSKRRYIPLIDEIVKEVDCESGMIKIIPLKGLFDEN